MDRTTSATSCLTARALASWQPPRDAGYSRAVALVNEVLSPGRLAVVLVALRARSDLLSSAHAWRRLRGTCARGGGALVHALPRRTAAAGRAGRPRSRGHRGSAGDRRWDAVARVDKRRRARAAKAACLRRRCSS